MLTHSIYFSPKQLLGLLKLMSHQGGSRTAIGLEVRLLGVCALVQVYLSRNRPTLHFPYRAPSTFHPHYLEIDHLAVGHVLLERRCEHSRPPGREARRHRPDE